MSKHTKGPWKVDYTKQNVRAGLGVNVAFCGESGVYGVNGSQSVGVMEARANARLIAAAPDLLAALQSIAECCDEDHAARDYASRQTEIRGIARAAIAKATGSADA